MAVSQSDTVPFQNESPPHFKLAHYVDQRESESRNFSNLATLSERAARCKTIGMSLSLILVAVQILVAIFALIRESGEDERFEGDTLAYRS